MEKCPPQLTITVSVLVEWEQMPNVTKKKKEEMKDGSVSVGSSHSTTLFLAIVVIL